MAIFCDDIRAAISETINECTPDRTFLFSDTTVLAVQGHRLPEGLRDAAFAMVPGEEHKDLATVAALWRHLSESGATRRSLLVNFGGGVVTDIGGFAAATFKRGIRFVNVPTTLLAMADASSGGKTGFDFCGLKNEIGVFAEPERTLICTRLLDTLPERELLSGCAEIMKMALIGSRADTMRIFAGDMPSEQQLLDAMLRMAVEGKERIVALDPREKGLRRVLNFGHTAGHAFESFLLAAGRPVSHGEAVAHGMLVALVLSHMLLGMEPALIHLYRDNFLRRYFGRLRVGCPDIPAIVALAGHDKKNDGSGRILATLLRAPGEPETGVPVTPEDMAAAIEIALQ